MSLLKIGTRGSPLALAQAGQVRDRLAMAHGLAKDEIEIVIIRTSGDMGVDATLAEGGGKGLFTKEIEEALLGGVVDVGVHSAKDMPTLLPQGLELSSFLEREDARDVFISSRASSVEALAPGAVVGTASLRRVAMVKRLRPDVVVVPLRGNVQTRLRKLEEERVDATILALAGLRRLGLEHVATQIFERDAFLPAVGQGAICIENRAGDERMRALVRAVNHKPTEIALTLERAYMEVLDGSCRMPIAGHAIAADGQVKFRGMILKPDGSQSHEVERQGAADDALRLGQDAGQELKAKAGPGFFD